MARRFPTIGLLFVLCVTAFGYGHAQTADRGQFQKFLASTANKTLISDALSSLPAEVFHICPDTVTSHASVQVESSITFGADGSPDTGSWWERIPVQGCGTRTVLN